MLNNWCLGPIQSIFSYYGNCPKSHLEKTVKNVKTVSKDRNHNVLLFLASFGHHRCLFFWERLNLYANVKLMLISVVPQLSMFSSGQICIHILKHSTGVPAINCIVLDSWRSLSLVPSLINSSTAARWKLSNWHAGLTPLTIFPLTVPLLSATAPPTFAPVSCGWRTWPSGSPARRTPYGGCTSRSGTGPWWCLQLKMRELKWKSSILGRRLQLRCRIYFGETQSSEHFFIHSDTETRRTTTKQHSRDSSSFMCCIINLCVYIAGNDLPYLPNYLKCRHAR